LSGRTTSTSKYIVLKILQFIPLLFGVVVVNFVIIHSAPGDPAFALAGRSLASEEYLTMIRHEYGLDKSLPEQFFIYLTQLLQLNLGYSLFYRSPVLDVILERVPATLLLAGTGLGIAFIFGIILGVLSSRKPRSFKSNAMSLFTLIGFSIPEFWLGQMLILVFSIMLGVFPVQGIITARAELTGLQYVGDVISHLFLPAVTYALFFLALVSRLTRAAMIEALSSDYVTAARAKGLKERTVLLRHALRNALLPVVTVLGLRAGVAISGAVLIETVFSWPGIGRLTSEAINARDNPMLMGLLIFLTTSVILSTTLTDVLYSRLDPRIRYR